MGWNAAEWFRKSDKRHLILKISLGSSGLLGFLKLLLVGPSLSARSGIYSSSVTNNSGRTVNIAVKLLFTEEAQGKQDILTAVFTVQLLLNLLVAFYFIFFWHHKNKIRLRSAIAIALDVCSIAIACATLSLANAAAATDPFDAEAARRLYPDVTEQELRGRVAKILGSALTTARVTLGASLVDTAVQWVAIAFWVWLLPPYCKQQSESFRPL